MVVKFGELVTNKAEKFNPLGSSEVFKCIELEHLSSDNGSLLGSVKSDNQKSIKNKFFRGQILYGKLRPYLRKYYLADFTGVCSSEIWVLTPKSKELSPYFLYFLIQSERFNNHVNLTTGTKMPRADWEHVKNFEFSLPSFEKQNKLAIFLLALEQRIQYQKKKINELKEQKKGYQQRVFNRELVFTDDNGQAYPEWEEKKLGNLLVSYTDLLGKRDYPVLSSTMSGIKIQSEYFTKKVASEDTSSYKVIPKGYLTYRSMSDTGDFYFNIQDLVDFGAVSPAYPVFSVSNEILCAYFKCMTENKSFKNEILKMKSGGTRYALPFSRLGTLKIDVPSLPEQEKISEFFSALDENIELNERKLELLKEQKKGYLQGIFG